MAQNFWFNSGLDKSTRQLLTGFLVRCWVLGEGGEWELPTPWQRHRMAGGAAHGTELRLGTAGAKS